MSTFWDISTNNYVELNEPAKMVAEYPKIIVRDTGLTFENMDGNDYIPPTTNVILGKYLAKCLS